MKKFKIFRAGRKNTRLKFKARPFIFAGGQKVTKLERPGLKLPLTNILISLLLIPTIISIFLFFKSGELGKSYYENLSTHITQELVGKNEPKKYWLHLVVVDLGLSKKITTQVLEQFPENTTFIYSPYAEGLEKYIETGKKQMIKLPFNELGELSLSDKLSRTENMVRLGKILQKTGNLKYIALPEDLRDNENFAFVKNVLNYSDFKYEYFDFKTDDEKNIWLDEKLDGNQILTKLNKLLVEVKNGKEVKAYILNPKKITINLTLRALIENSDIGISRE
jgi:hypothetical protein